MLATKTVTAAAIVLLTLVRSSAAEDLRLLDAVKRQDEAGVRLLIKQKVDPEARQADGTTALHWAAHRNNLAIAQALLQAGAKVNVVTELGVTPLVLAGENGNGDMVTAFLEAGANPNVLTVAGESPLMAAARSGSCSRARGPRIPRRPTCFTSRRSRRRSPSTRFRRQRFMPSPTTARSAR